MSFSSRHHRPPPRIPRVLLLRAAIASFGLGGCVPATAYEEASSAAAVEREGHRRAVAQLQSTQAQLSRVKQELQTLRGETDGLQAQLERDEEKLAEAELSVLTKEKAHEQEALLVTQLRGELARVGEHLKSYAGDKDALQTRLDEMEAQLKEKEQRIAYLEAQINGLRTNLKSTEKDSEKAQQDLDGALSELAELQDEVGDAAPKEAAPKDAEASPPRDTDEVSDSPPEEEREDESIYEPAEEILPSEEAN